MPTSLTQQGNSWLELLAMFELSGGSVDIIRNLLVNRARSRHNLRAVLVSFKSEFRKVVGFCIPEHNQFMFKPSRLSTLRLKQLGFSTFTSCLMCLPVLSKGAATSLTQAVLSLRKHISKNICIQHREGMLGFNLSS